MTDSQDRPPLTPEPVMETVEKYVENLEHARFTLKFWFTAQEEDLTSDFLTEMYREYAQDSTRNGEPKFTEEAQKEIIEAAETYYREWTE